MKLSPPIGVLLCALAFAVPSRADEPIVTLRAYKGLGKVYSAAFSPDGKTLATAETKTELEPFGTHFLVTLWDVQKQKERATLKHEGLVQSVAWSPDGKLLATATADFKKADKEGNCPGIVALWDTTTGKRTVSLQGHDRGVISVAFSPDGKTLASADVGGEVKVWDATTRKVRYSIDGSKGRVFGWDMKISPDGKALAIAGGEYRDKGSGVRLFQLETGKKGRELPSTLFVDAIDFSRDGKVLAYNSYGMGKGKGIFVRLCDPLTGKEHKLLDSGADFSYSALAFSPDGKILAAGRKNPFRGVALWDVSAGKVLPAKLEGPIVQNVLSLAFSPDGKQLASASLDGSLCLWDVEKAVKSK